MLYVLAPNSAQPNTKRIQKSASKGEARAREIIERQYQEEVEDNDIEVGLSIRIGSDS